MMRSKLILGGVMLGMIALMAVVLQHMKAGQKMGGPGVLTRALPDAPAGSLKQEILMPEALPGWTSEIVTNAETVLEILPKDTSYRVRVYRSTADDFWGQITTVLMGTDRTSIHKPQICLTGQGWAIDATKSTVETIRMERPVPYELPVNKLIATKQFADPQGRVQNVSCLYIYWYVDDQHMTADYRKWMLWWMPQDLLLNGRLQRWAYISVFAPCLPGKEAETYDRLKKLIASSVPEFQVVPPTGK